MPTGKILGLTGFQPGDRVRVILTKTTRFPGVVITLADAHMLWKKIGRDFESFDFRPGQICVAVTVYGKTIPLPLDANQLETDLRPDYVSARPHSYRGPIP